MYIKEFDKWNNVKKRVQSEQRQVNIRKGEIRWVSFGVNVGSEIDGKGDTFTRPALVLHVIGSHLALIVPLSTKAKDIPGYLQFPWKDKINAICIHQMRVVSQKRILHRLGRISDKKLSQYCSEITKFYSFL